MTSRASLIVLFVVAAMSATTGQALAQKKATPESVAADIKGVTSGGNSRYFAVNRLKDYEAPLPEKQAEVAALLMKIVKDKGDRAFDCMLALGVWATDTELKEVKEYLGDSKFAKAAAIVYSKRKYAPAGKDLAPYLEGGPVDRKDVVQALILIGPESEVLVVPYLMSKKKDAIRGALDVLAKVGTKKSVDAITECGKTYMKDNNISVAVKQALSKIEEREMESKEKK
jgi:hypothetical protein